MVLPVREIELEQILQVADNLMPEKQFVTELIYTSAKSGLQNIAMAQLKEKSGKLCNHLQTLYKREYGLHGPRTQTLTGSLAELGEDVRITGPTSATRRHTGNRPTH